MKKLFVIAATSKQRNVLGIAAVLMTLAVAAGSAAAAESDGVAIMRRSLEAGTKNAERVDTWISDSRVVERQYDADGSVKSEEVSTYEQVRVQGVLVRKLNSRNGKPVTASDRKKNDQHIAKEIETARDPEKKKRKDREFNQEILDAFDFKQAGEEIVAGRKALVLIASPRAGFKPQDMRAGVFPHVRGKIWIDSQDYAWAKAEADAFEPISIGFSLIAKLDEGAHLFLEQSRMPDGVWEPLRNGLHASARLALVKRISIEQVTTYSNFRRAPEESNRQR